MITWLTEHFEVTVADIPTTEFSDTDVIIVDEKVLKKGGKEINALKKASGDVFLPVLLFSTRSDIKLHKPSSLKAVDEIILAPIEKVELETRIRSLLHTRSISFQGDSSKNSRFFSGADTTPLAIYTKDIALWTWDLLADSVCYSPEWKIQAGIDTVEESQGIDLWLKKIHPDDISEVTKHLNQIKEQPNIPVEFDYRFLHADGSYRSIHSLVWALSDKNGHAVRLLGLNFDLTERKRTEEVLRISEEKFRTTLYSIGDGVIVVDHNGLVQHMNPVAEELTGWHEREACGKLLEEVFRIVCEETGEPAENPVTRVLQRGIVTGLANHTLLISKDGRKIPIADSGAPIRNASGKVVGVVLVFRDQTTERTAQKATMEAKNLAEGIVATVRESLVILDNLLRVVLVNRSFCNTFNFTPEEVEGKPFLELRNQQFNVPGLRQLLLEILPKNTQFEDFIAELPAGNDMRKTFVLNARRIYDDPNSTRLILLAMEDVTERMLAEQELWESEQRFRSLANATATAIFVYQGERFVYANPAVTEITGYSAEEFLQMKFWDIVHPDFQDLIRQRGIDRQRGKPVPARYSFKVIRKDGKEIWIDFTAGKITWNGQSAAIGSAFDITRQKEIEDALRESEQRFRSFFENNMAVMLLIDPDDGRIVDANPAASQFYGWTREEIMKKRIMDINTLPSEVLKVEMQKVRDQLRSHFEFRHRRADGSERDVEVFSSKVHIAGKDLLFSIIHDVTAKKQAEVQTRLLGKSVEQSPVSIIITDASGTMIYVNPMFTKITGYEFHEAIGNTPRILKSGVQSQEFYENLWKTISSGQTWAGELCNRRKDGTLYWEDAIISPILNEYGLITNYVGVKEDITERRQMLQDLIRAKERAEESDRLKTAFLTNLSHEVRTPMNAIMGFTELLRREELPQDKKNEYIEIVHRSGQDLLSKISDIVEISKIETRQVTFSPETFDLNQLLRELQQESLAFLPRDKEIKLAFSILRPDTEYFLRTDRAKLRYILSAFLSNGIKFTEKGFVDLGYEEQDGNIVLFVRDSGIGIDSKYHEAVFQRFFRIENDMAIKAGGLGLGLAISKAYAELMGGKIWVESEPGKGSTFRLSIPIQEVSISGITHTMTIASEKKQLKTGECILIAEDDDINYFYLEELLSKSNYNLVRARNGQEAIDICRENDKVKLVLLDLKMPVINGYEAFKKIREIRPDLPVIAQTAYALSDEKIQILEAGFDGYLPKPIHREDFWKVLRAFLPA